MSFVCNTPRSDLTKLLTKFPNTGSANLFKFLLILLWYIWYSMVFGEALKITVIYFKSGWFLYSTHCAKISNAAVPLLTYKSSPSLSISFRLLKDLGFRFRDKWETRFADMYWRDRSPETIFWLDKTTKTAFNIFYNLQSMLPEAKSFLTRW